MKKLLILCLLFTTNCFATHYYVSSAGNDSNPGTLASPWLTTTKVNSSSFVGGDIISFNGGNSFSGGITLSTNVSGTSSTTPLTINSYGTGRATITSSTIAIYTSNVAGIVCQNLILTGTGASNSYGILHENYTTGSTVYDYLKDTYLTISSFDIGVAVAAYPSDNSHSGFSNVEVSHCTISNGINYGIYGYSSYGAGYGHSNVHLFSDTISNFVGVAGPLHSGNGITFAEVNGLTAEYNIVHDCGANNTSSSGPVGLWCYEATNALLQYNEVYNQATNSAADGGGFDFDGGVTNSIMQYNYSHNNYGPGFMFYSYNDTYLTTWNNNIMRYNISQNDATHNTSSYSSIFIGATSTMTNAYCYNNTIYNSLSGSGLLGFYGTSVGGATGIVSNNIFYSANNANLINTIGTNPTIPITGNDWFNTGNFSMLWNGNTYTTYSSWQTATGQEKISGSNVGKTSNPLLMSPGAAGVTGGYAPALLKAYRLSQASPMISNGLNLFTVYGINVGSQDYYGNSIPNSSGFYDIGATQYKVLIVNGHIILI